MRTYFSCQSIHSAHKHQAKLQITCRGEPYASRKEPLLYYIFSLIPKEELCVRAVCACICIFSLSHSRGSICARTLAFSLGQEVEKSIAMHVHGDRERLYSTHYIFIYLTLKGSTDCAAARASEGVCSAAHTDAGIHYVVFSIGNTHTRGQSWGLRYCASAFCLAPTWSVCVL
jgi:hypothetical protein